jgi:hypothetical protein
VGRRDLVVLGLAVLLAVFVRLPVIDVPFHRTPEGVGSFYGILARNYLRLEWSEHVGVPVMSPGVAEDQPPAFYHHHPPLVPLLIAGSYGLFGEGEWQTRLWPSLFNVGCIVLIHLLMRGVGRPVAAGVAAMLFAVAPISIYYGGHPDVINSQLVFFVLLSVAAYLRFQAAPGGRWLVLLLAAFIPAAATDWPAFLLVPVFCAHYAVSRRGQGWRWMVGFALAATVLFAVVYFYITLASGAQWNWLVEKLSHRSFSAVGDRNDHYTLAGWLGEITRHNLRMHTLPLLAAAGAWLVVFGWRRGDEGARLTRLLLGWALLHVLVGQQGVYVHDWWWWPLTPGLVLAAGLAADELLRGARPAALRRTGAIAVVLLLLAFTAWTTSTHLPRFVRHEQTHGDLGYSVLDMGAAIQQAAPEMTDPVIIPWNDYHELQLWYYGDRPLILAVWDPITLQHRMTDGIVDLPFGFQQPWPYSPVGLVFPRIFSEDAPEFLEYLMQTYRHEQTEHFLIFRLAERR